MSSTVTTTTVAVVTTAVSTGAMATLSLVAVVLLAGLLVGREVVHNAHAGGGVKRLARGLDIATLPLVLAFALIVGIGMQG